MRQTKAKPFDFQDIVDLLNVSRSVSIDQEPVDKRDGRWALYRGRYKVHTSTLTFEVLYIGADATKESVDEASQHYRRGRTQVVYAPSLDARGVRFHREKFGASPELFWDTKAYLRSFIREELEVYLDKLRNQSPRFYIEPQVETPAGTKGKVPNPVLSALRAPRFEEATSEGISILLGEPGQGKTYMSQFVVSTLAKDPSLVPIYINSSQWESMPRDHVSSLQKTITHSFRYFEAPITWVDGQEDRFLRTTLRADLFRIVFDGFDEYILRNEGRLGVAEALNELVTLAQSTGARILITSRSSFWDSNVDEPFVKESGIRVYRILPFDTQHARNYFNYRFGTNHPNTDRATGVYTDLARHNAEFVGRGFVLKLVADLIEEQPKDLQVRQEDVSAMRWLMEAFCDREVIRQKLPITALEQLTALETFAAEVAMGAQPDSESLEICVGEVASRLTAQDRAECVKRMEPHPLLTKTAASDLWQWSQEQIGNIFLAEWICRQASSGNLDGIRRFLQAQRLAPSQMTDLASMIVDLAADKTGTDGAKRFVADVVKQILTAARRGAEAGASKDGRTLATTIALKEVEKHAPAGSTRKDRTTLLLELLHGPPIVGVAFTGAIARMDLRGVTFRDCRFENVMWANVILDSGTVFEGCHFVRGLVEHTIGLGLCAFRNCTWDDEAEDMIRSAKVRDGQRSYTKEDLKADLSKVVGKFITRGGFFQTVEVRNLKRGPITESKYADEVIQQVIARLLEHHHISGVTEGGYKVRDDSKEAIRFFASNGVFTGPLREAYEELVRKKALD